MSFSPRAMPSDQQALYDAYVAATGMAVSLAAHRKFDLRQLVALEAKITPAEVRTVLHMVRRKIERGDGGFVEASLMWKNAMQPFTMEERVLLLRQSKARKKGAAAKPQTVRTDALPDGSTVTRLTPPGEAPDPPAPMAGKSLRELMPEAFRRKP